MTRARDVARDQKKMRQVKQRAEGRERDKKKRETAYWRRGVTFNQGEKRSERGEDERRKGKGKLPAGEMERYQLHWPEAHTGPLALLRPSTAGANGVQTQLQLTLESNVLGAEGSLDLAHH